ncbi:MAG: Do family serine endopeptidase [Cytophagales bacterium]|nr:Do family serine endopeptidase [Cytophagales bacterium]
MISKRQFFIGTMVAAWIGGVVAVGGYRFWGYKESRTVVYKSENLQPQTHLTNLLDDSSFTVPQGLNFIYASEVATPAVVHIQCTYKAKTVQHPNYHSPLDQLFKDFFGDRFFDFEPPEQREYTPKQSVGSGVIIAEDGYIVTNNHVTDNADQIEVILNDNRKYEAKLVGSDPSTDLSLLKIDVKGLPYLQFGSSDALQIGEWVLAVGNPFNLTSTVTAGIVSAKARNLDIIDRSSMPVTSFIQTDAVVNRGNSGGALVNLKGELVGINTAIATPTGAFAGYSFAIPSSIVKKVADDLMKYGTIRRAVLGIGITDVNAELAKEKKLTNYRGVYVGEVYEKSAAATAGLKEGDVITAIDDNEVKNTSQLIEQVARHKPGDNVRITFYRKDKKRTVTATLKDVASQSKIARKESTVSVEGATFENIDKATQKKMNVKGGVQVKEVGRGKWQQVGIKKGFIIKLIDKEIINDVDDLVRVLNSKKGAILIEGVYPSGEEAYYALKYGDA